MRRDNTDAANTALLGTSELAQVAQPWPSEWTAAGVIETLEPLVNELRREKIQRVVGARLASVTVVLDGPYDPHNGAAVMRSCEAFGVQQLHVVPDQPFLVSHKVAQGSERWLDVVTHDNADRALQELVRLKYTIVTSHPEGTLVPEALASIPKVAIVMGNEHAGIGPVFRAAKQQTVCIPMRGFVESLNLSVSAAILLAAATRGRPGDLGPNEQARLYARGLYYSVVRAHDILLASAAR